MELKEEGATPTAVNPSVPEGYELAFTPKGIPYFKKLNETTEEDDEAANEYKRENLSIFISLDEIKKRFGVGTVLYFDFLKFIMISNSVLVVLAMIHWGVYLSKKTGSMEMDDLFISAYSHDQYGVWMAMNIIAIVIWFSYGPIYYWYIVKKYTKEEIGAHDNPYALSGMGYDTIKENAKYTSSQRFWGRVASFIVFLALLGVSAGLTFVIQWAGSKKNRDPTKAFNIFSFIITFCVVSVNLFFQGISGKVVAMEKHRTWSAFRKHHTFKKLVFKMANVTAMYLALAFSNPNLVEGRCGFRDTGSKFLSLILIDLFIMNGIEYARPLMTLWCKKNIRKMAGKGGDEADRPEFDVADEYLEIFYRQFIIYMGMVVFPLMTVLGLFTNIIEYPLDKYRMLKICQKPKRLDLSMKRFLVFWLTMMALGSLIIWPQGAVWVMSANRGRSEAFNCCRLLPGDDSYTCPIST